MLNVNWCSLSLLIWVCAQSTHAHRRLFENCVVECKQHFCTKQANNNKNIWIQSFSVNKRKRTNTQKYDCELCRCREWCEQFMIQRDQWTRCRRRYMGNGCQYFDLCGDWFVPTARQQFHIFDGVARLSLLTHTNKIWERRKNTFHDEMRWRTSFA